MPRPGSTREQGALAVAVVWLPAVAATVAWVATGRLHPVGSLGVVARQVAHAVDRPHGMPPGAPLLKRDVLAMRLRPERALRVGDVALLPVLHHLLDRPVPGPTTLDRRRTFPEVARPFGLQDLDRTDRHALAPSLLAHQLTLPCSQLRMGLLVCLVLLLGLAGGAFAVGGTVGRLPGDLVRLLRLPGLLTRAGEVAPSQEPPGATLQAGDQVAGPLQDGRDRSGGPAWRCARRWRSGINAGRPGLRLVGGCGSTPTWPPAEVAGARWQDSDAPAGGGLVRTTKVVPSPPALPSGRRSARHARASSHHARCRNVANPPGCGRSRPLAPVWVPACAGKPGCLGRLTRAGTRAAPPPSHSNATGGNMAALFLVLAVADAVLLGDAVLANTSASSVSVFDQSITGFTQGQLLVVAAGLGLLLVLLLGLAWRSSGARRAKRRQLRAAHRDLQGRVAQLERDNATLRQEQERLGRLAELREASSQAQQARERASQPPVDAHA